MNIVEIVAKAFEAGNQAARVREAQWGDRFGMCGFASVRIDAYQGKKIRANSNIGKALEAVMGRKGYDGRFYTHQCCDYNGQNVDIKEFAAEAFANVLEAHGFNVIVDSRLD